MTTAILELQDRNVALRGNFQIVAAVFDLLCVQINPLQVEIGLHFAQSNMDRQ
jgi:hypothetical protein